MQVLIFQVKENICIVLRPFTDVFMAEEIGLEKVLKYFESFNLFMLN